MNPLLHALNIGTLANWLSVAVFGTVAALVPQWKPIPPPVVEEETRIIPEDFTLGESLSPEPTGEPESGPAADPPVLEEEILPAPPELPEIAEFAPLPEIPDLPSPVVQAAPAPAPVPPQARPATRPAAAKPTTGKPSTGRPATGGRSGAPGAAGSGSASGVSDAARLAAGRMPAPSYPAAARRAGQTGTVMIEFTVDTNGRVISAYAKSPSPWPLLNEEAVRTVRRWKFPPGGVMKLQRPIVFQLR